MYVCTFAFLFRHDSPKIKPLLRRIYITRVCITVKGNHNLASKDDDGRPVELCSVEKLEPTDCVACAAGASVQSSASHVLRAAARSENNSRWNNAATRGQAPGCFETVEQTIPARKSPEP